MHIDCTSRDVSRSELRVDIQGVLRRPEATRNANQTSRIVREPNHGEGELYLEAFEGVLILSTLCQPLASVHTLLRPLAILLRPKLLVVIPLREAPSGEERTILVDAVGVTEDRHTSFRVNKTQAYTHTHTKSYQGEYQDSKPGTPMTERR